MEYAFYFLFAALKMYILNKIQSFCLLALGLCLNSLGSSCSPKKTKLESHSVVVYVNSTPYCTSIELEHHRGPCRCECDKSQASCDQTRHLWRPDTCTCQCLPGLARDKIRCVNSTRHTWDSDTCECRCKYKHTCGQPGQLWDGDTCSCQETDTAIQCITATNIDLPHDVDTDPRLGVEHVYLINFVMLSIAVAGVMIVLCSLFILRWSGSVRGQDTDPSFSQWAQEDSRGHEEAEETISIIGGPLPHCTLTLVRSGTNDLREK